MPLKNYQKRALTKYNHSEKGKEAQKRYEKSEKCKELRRKYYFERKEKDIFIKSLMLIEI